MAEDSSQQLESEAQEEYPDVAFQGLLKKPWVVAGVIAYATVFWTLVVYVVFFL